MRTRCLSVLSSDAGLLSTWRSARRLCRGEGGRRVNRGPLRRPQDARLPASATSEQAGAQQLRSQSVRANGPPIPHGTNRSCRGSTLAAFHGQLPLLLCQVASPSPPRGTVDLVNCVGFVTMMARNTLVSHCAARGSKAGTILITSLAPSQEGSSVSARREGCLICLLS